jgi:hypothetical protein
LKLDAKLFWLLLHDNPHTKSYANSKQMCPDTPRFFCPGGKYKGVENYDVDFLI